MTQYDNFQAGSVRAIIASSKQRDQTLRSAIIHVVERFNELRNTVWLALMSEGSAYKKAGLPVPNPEYQVHLRMQLSLYGLVGSLDDFVRHISDNNAYYTVEVWDDSVSVNWTEHSCGYIEHCSLDLPVTWFQNLEDLDSHISSVLKEHYDDIIERDVSNRLEAQQFSRAAEAAERKLYQELHAKYGNQG